MWQKKTSMMSNEKLNTTIIMKWKELLDKMKWTTTNVAKQLSSRIDNSMKLKLEGVLYYELMQKAKYWIPSEVLFQLNEAV